MPQEELEALLGRMGAIADAVNAFKSETVQHEAFTALIAAFHGKHQGPTQRVPAAEAALEMDKTEQAASTKRRPAIGPAKTREARSDWKMLKDLDLNPAGKLSFDEFIKEKQPRSNEDKYSVAVYYLSNVLEIENITMDHVGTTFRLTKIWKEPTNLRAGLSVTSSRKGTIDTTNCYDIKITPTGRNFVEHDLPPKQEKK